MPQIHWQVFICVVESIARIQKVSNQIHTFSTLELQWQFWAHHMYVLQRIWSTISMSHGGLPFSIPFIMAEIFFAILKEAPLPFGRAMIYLRSLIGGKYLLFLSSCSVKWEIPQLSQFVCLFEESVFIFQFLNAQLCQTKHNCEFHYSKIEK